MQQEKERKGGIFLKDFSLSPVLLLPLPRMVVRRERH